jgi:hypothetical protein
MDETFRMLGREHELDLARDAEKWRRAAEGRRRGRASERLPKDRRTKLMSFLRLRSRSEAAPSLAVRPLKPGVGSSLVNRAEEAKMTRKTIVTCMLAAAAVGATLAGVSSATVAADSFACPNPKVLPLGKIYGKSRGTSFCNDGAQATAIVAGKKLAPFTGGVCWKNKEGVVQVGIGTMIGPKRIKSDPPGFVLIDVKPGGVIKDSVDLGNATVSWGFTVKVTYAAGKKSGNWSGVEPRLVGGKLAHVPAGGTFTCKRILDAPEQ